MLKIITISGLDGSGKSTQVEMLKKYLEAQDKRVFYFHAVQFSLANKLSKKSGEKGNASVTKANLFSIQLRKIFLIIDSWRFRKLRQKLENDGFDYILSDRYFYDSLINIAYLKQSMKERFFTESLNLYKIIKPDLAIYLKTDPDVIIQREKTPDQGIDYLKKKKELYEEFAKSNNLKIINGNQNKETIFNLIKGFLL
jgi:dTMP kinase